MVTSLPGVVDKAAKIRFNKSSIFLWAFRLKKEPGSIEPGQSNREASRHKYVKICAEREGGRTFRRTSGQGPGWLSAKCTATINKIFIAI